MLLWGGLTLLFLLLRPIETAAQILSKTNVEPETTEAFKVLQLVCVSIGIIAGSLIAVESRRWRTFFLGLIGISAIASAIAAIGVRYIQFPKAQPLIIPAAAGLALGIVLIGSWWWGHRQGYTHALYIALLSPNKHDDELDWLFQNWLSQNEESETNGAERHPTFWQSVYFRAAAARYRRLKRRPEIDGLYRLIIDDVLKDAEDKREKQLRAAKTQRLEALINAVDGQYSFTLHSPSATSQEHSPK